MLARGPYSGAEIAGIVVVGVLLHIPVVGLFVVPYLPRRAVAA
jgi:hypothetical protein